ncbi:hypothetical protein GE09DRAFT_1211360 [Coniochaeta sp. 2T2.1]|nr:hypothetical protein GE09DRAFT_1211360 [Coniochaeta sp. 2T2.1]
MSSTGSQQTSLYYEDDYYYEPADFMHAPVRGGTAESHNAGSSSRSGYTSSSTVHGAASTRSSDASSFAPSIFTRGSARTSGGASSRPHQPAHQTNFNQALTTAVAAVDFAPINDNPPVAATAASHPLWCELCVTRNCSATFRIDQTREWIEHHIRHLRGRFPARLVCWFCDDVSFGNAGHSSEDRYADFVDRMEHIRGHISSEYRTRDDMRPDFAMINHLADRGLIDDSMRRLALGYSELPEALHLPGSNASGSAHSYEPQRLPPGPGLAHDLDRERRHQRRRGGQPSRHAHVHHR